MFTGEVVDTSVGIAGGRIAWVGRDGGEGARAVDLDGGTLVPGLIEPHCHADIVYTPPALAAAIGPHGTTTVCADTLFLSLAFDDDDLLSVLRRFDSLPVKFLWNLRNVLDGRSPDEIERLGVPRMEALLARVAGVVASGEMTGWPRLLAGDERLSAFVEDVVDAGLRVDGHAPGASRRTLDALAAAGVTADHEAISSDEVRERVDAGFWVMLRHSSLRPDAPALASAVRSAPYRDRFMLTTDGPVAADAVEGHLDHVVRQLLAEGVPAVDAIRMATVQPATYLGLDAHLGSIASGRCADLVVVDDITTFRPVAVYADGKAIGSAGRPTGRPDPEPWDGPPAAGLRRGNLTPGRLRDVCGRGTWVTLDGIITRACAPLPGNQMPDDASYLAVVDRAGEHVVGGVVRGIAVPAIVSTYNASLGVLLIGRDPTELMRAYDTVVAGGGGIATPGTFVPLRVAGFWHTGSMEEVAADLGAVVSELALPPTLPPLEYLLLFLTTGILPDIRFTRAGVVDVKSGRVLAGAVRI